MEELKEWEGAKEKNKAKQVEIRKIDENERKDK